MRTDHKVTFRRREEIKQIAERARSLGKEFDRAGFQITNYLRMLAHENLLKTGLLQIRTFSAKDGEAPAYVTYNPTTLHVDQEIWGDADDGEPGARFILAHELGHIILHDHYAQPFSGEKQKWITMDEESAEWQANTFADHFLISDMEVCTYITVKDTAIYCFVDRVVALRRLAPMKYTGNHCGCGSTAIVRYGTVEKCEECSNTWCS
jgi:Zn-dependent peptidase ImmA (M78 family)